MSVVKTNLLIGSSLANWLMAGWRLGG